MRQGRALLILLLFPPMAGATERPVPAAVIGNLSLEKSALSISYNPTHKQPDWVFYRLGARELRNCVKRSNNFRPDPEVPRAQSAQHADYARSGFDRGHLSPVADNRFSAAAMSESFYYSNISPQLPRFNQGIWARLENLVRAWALNLEGLWVTTGPVLEPDLPHIGASRVSTPRFFYKVLLTQQRRARQAIAFLLPAEATGELAPYALSVRQLEELTGIDFHRGLPDEDAIEPSLDLSAWPFRARYSPLPCLGLIPVSFSFPLAALPHH
jgi:endonuclease G, mitochondrial